MPAGRTRASLRRGGTRELIARVAAGELRPDFGPRTISRRHRRRAGGARAPLVAFNLELAAPATVEQAKTIAARIREGGEEGLPGLRAIGLSLAARGGVAQVSCNIEDHRAVPLAEVVRAVAAHAPVSRCELVGLAPRAAFDGFPQEIPVDGLRLTEEALAAAGLPSHVA